LSACPILSAVVERIAAQAHSTEALADLPRSRAPNLARVASLRRWKAQETLDAQATQMDALAKETKGCSSIAKRSEPIARKRSS
jgi:hypothetical protein